MSVRSLTSAGKLSIGRRLLVPRHGVLQRAKVSALHFLLLGSVLCILGCFRRGFESEGGAGETLQTKPGVEGEQRNPSVVLNRSRQRWGCACREKSKP